MLLPAWDRPTTAHLQLLMDKFQRIETGEIPRLMLFLPPGSAKSTYGSKLFPAWFLGRKRGRSCGSAWKRDPDSGVIGVEKGPLIPVV
ncbi:hypothetical protein SAMN04488241_111180 [Sphingomonas rubra]|uniref:Uncharacterized protein n=2 Tax=Sphingomonas rubra TaxID=634430 RepID=A0A1I5UH09_9SPHN|nr:hypothetical protein SAMN04488241_111180 [Sphingomonas rubra]